MRVSKQRRSGLGGGEGNVFGLSVLREVLGWVFWLTGIWLIRLKVLNLIWRAESLL